MRKRREFKNERGNNKTLEKGIKEEKIEGGNNKIMDEEKNKNGTGEG